MHMTRNYHWSKGSLVRQVEDRALSNLAAVGDREESASHHENHAKIMKNEIAQKSSGIIPDDSGTLQSISSESPVSPKASWVDFTDIDFSSFSMIF